MERIGFRVQINLGNAGSNKVTLRQTSHCFQYANMKLNFQERNVVFMDFSFSLGIVWSHSSMEGKELTEKFIPVNSIQKLNKTINLSGTSSANTSKTDKWIHCFIHKTNIY